MYSKILHRDFKIYPVMQWGCYGTDYTCEPKHAKTGLNVNVILILWYGWTPNKGTRDHSFNQIFHLENEFYEKRKEKDKLIWIIKINAAPKICARMRAGFQESQKRQKSLTGCFSNEKVLSADFFPFSSFPPLLSCFSDYPA